MRARVWLSLSTCSRKSDTCCASVVVGVTGSEGGVAAWLTLELAAADTGMLQLPSSDALKVRTEVAREDVPVEE